MPRRGSRVQIPFPAPNFPPLTLNAIFSFLLHRRFIGGPSPSRSITASDLVFVKLALAQPCHHRSAHALIRLVVVVSYLEEVFPQRGFSPRSENTSPTPRALTHARVLPRLSGPSVLVLQIRGEEMAPLLMKSPIKGIGSRRNALLLVARGRIE